MTIPKNVEHLLFALGVAAAALAGIAIPLIVRSFMPTFDNFGFALPGVTRFFVEARWLFLLLPLVVAVAWFAWPTRAMRSIAAIAFGVGSFVVFVPLALFAMYYAVFRLSTAV